MGGERPPTFGDRSGAGAAEIARLEGRDADAKRLYEEAIGSAREHGFVQNEGLAQRAGRALLRGARLRDDRRGLSAERAACYLRWGADGKVRQLDQRTRICGRSRHRRATARSARRSSSWTSRRWSRPRRPSRARSFSTS